MVVDKDFLPPVIFLMGPTAIGKTDFAKKISEDWPIEVISVDRDGLQRNGHWNSKT